jgi:hypothetical protein
MRIVGATLLVLALTTPAAAETLSYRGEVGRVAEYQVTTRATGRQLSLGERRPVRVEAEYAVREEVVASEEDGSFHVQVTGRAVKVKDGTRAFGSQRLDFPAILLYLSPRGEVLGSEAVSEAVGVRAGAGAALLGQFLPVVMPTGPVEAGQTWEWERDSAKQTNRLVEVRGRAARIASTARAPVAFTERSSALGLTTAVAGTQTQTSTLDLDLDSGVVLHHKGNLALRTKTEVAMETAEGRRTFPLEMELRLAFESRLVRLDGQPVSAAMSGEKRAR